MFHSHRERSPIISRAVLSQRNTDLSRKSITDRSILQKSKTSTPKVSERCTAKPCGARTFRKLLAFLGAWVLVVSVQPTRAADAALERTRKQVRMLDDLYKAAVVLITTHYVSDKSTLPAGTAAVTLFDAMKKKGWHEVRLLDATGKPAVRKQLASGRLREYGRRTAQEREELYDRVVERDGKRYLRAATPIPVLVEKCAMCHPHFKEAKEGEPIGALSYTLPIE